eukprot:gene3351-3628_t
MDITKLVSSLFWTLSEYQGETGFHQSLQSEQAKQVLIQADLTEKKLFKGSAVLLQASHQKADGLQATDLQAADLQGYKPVWVAAVKGSAEGVTELKQFGRHKITHNRVSGTYKTLQDDSGSIQRSPMSDVAAVLQALQYAIELKFTWHELQDTQHRSYGQVIDDLDWQDLAVTDALEAYQSFLGRALDQVWTGYVTWESKNMNRSLSGRFKACGHLFKPKEVDDDGTGSYWARYKALQDIELHFVVDLPVVKQGNQLNAGFETGPWAAPPQDPEYHTIRKEQVAIAVVEEVVRHDQ